MFFLLLQGLCACARGIAGPGALMSDLVAPCQGLAVEVLQSQEGTRGEEIGTDVLNGSFDAPFLVTSGRAARTRGEMIVSGELQEARMEMDGITATFEHHTAEVIGRQVSGCAAPIVKGMNVAEEEILERLVEKEFEPQGPAVGKGENEAGQTAAGVPDGEFAKVSPVGLALFAGKSRESEKGLTAGWADFCHHAAQL